MIWALVASSVAIKHLLLSSLSGETAFIAGFCLEYYYLMQYPVIHMPANRILSGALFAQILGVDGPVPTYHVDSDAIWYHSYTQNRLLDLLPPLPYHEPEPHFGDPTSSSSSPFPSPSPSLSPSPSPSPSTPTVQDIPANGPLSLMPPGVNLVLIAGLILVFFGIVFHFFISRAPHSVAAQSESILKDGAAKPCRSAIKWPVLLCISATFILGRVSVSSGLFEEMRDTIILIVALAVVVFSSAKLMYASSNAVQQHVSFHTHTGSSSADVLSEPPAVDTESVFGKNKVNGKYKNSAISRSDSINSQHATGNELATIDMETFAIAAASTATRHTGMRDEFPSASIPHRHENDKHVPLATALLRDDDTYSTMTPEVDSGTESSEPSLLNGDEDAGTTSSSSPCPSEVVEDPVSGSLSTENSTTRRSKKKGKKSDSRRKTSASQKRIKFASLGTTLLRMRTRATMVMTLELDGGTEPIKLCHFDGDVDARTISTPSQSPFEVVKDPSLLLSYDLKFAVKEFKANGECKDSAISRSDSAKSRGASPFTSAIGNEMATIDMKTRANAAASTTERDKGMFAEFPSASIPLRNENDKFVPLVTTRLKDDYTCGTMLNITPRSSAILMDTRNTEPSWMARRRSLNEAATIDTKIEKQGYPSNLFLHLSHSAETKTNSYLREQHRPRTSETDKGTKTIKSHHFDGDTDAVCFRSRRGFLLEFSSYRKYYNREDEEERKEAWPPSFGFRTHLSLTVANSAASITKEEAGMTLSLSSWSVGVTLVNAVVSITKREAGILAKLVPRLPLREEKNKFASLDTTTSEDEDRGGTITPETDSRTKPTKPFILMEMLTLGRTRLAFPFYAE
ncbi:hypothetical protein ACEPAG_9307 [Sanghuangporus baumii]